MRKELKGRSFMARVIGAKELSAILPLILLFVVSSVVQPNFLSVSNLFDILRTASFTFILAIPLTFLMSSCQMDLSIGATTAMGGIIAAMAQTNGVPLSIAILLGLLTGALIGYINGVLVVYYKLPAFISTMGMQYVISGLVAVITNNNAVTGISKEFRLISQTRLFGVIALPVIYALVLGIIGHILMSRCKYGREVLAVGGNRETAFLAGINYKAKHIQIFTAVGFCAALTGILLCSRFSSAQISAGSGTELTIMASVIIGGTSLFGGTGTVLGSAIGCVLFATITNALIVMGISTNWQKVVYGAILIIALFLNNYRQKKSAGM